MSLISSVIKLELSLWLAIGSANELKSAKSTAESVYSNKKLKEDSD